MQITVKLTKRFIWSVLIQFERIDAPRPKRLFLLAQRPGFYAELCKLDGTKLVRQLNLDACGVWLSVSEAYSLIHSLWARRLIKFPKNSIPIIQPWRGGLAGQVRAQRQVILSTVPELTKLGAAVFNAIAKAEQFMFAKEKESTCQ